MTDNPDLRETLRRARRGIVLGALAVGLLIAIGGALVGAFRAGTSGLLEYALWGALIGVALGAIFGGIGAAVTWNEGLKVGLKRHFRRTEIRPDLSNAPQGLTRNHIICIDGTCAPTASPRFLPSVRSPYFTLTRCSALEKSPASIFRRGLGMAFWSATPTCQPYEVSDRDDRLKMFCDTKDGACLVIIP